MESNKEIFKRLERIDNTISKLDFSQEWFDMIDRDYLDMVEEAKNTDLLLYWNISRYLQELRNLKLALKPVNSENET